MQYSKEENTLIAEFMGRKFEARLGDTSYQRLFTSYTECLEYIKKHDLNGYTPQLGWGMGCGQYHESWEWLMPVVDRIESLLLSVQITDNNCFISWLGAEPDDKEFLKRLEQFDGIDEYGDTKIEAVYNAVSKFIEWYNDCPK